MSRGTRSGLWAHPNFLKLWIADTISFFGSQISALALPLVAVLELDATAGEMGVLFALSNLPFVLLGLLAGVWVDRYRRRPILIGMNVLQAAALALVPLAVVLDMLRIELLWVVAFVAGCGSMLGRIAWASYLPSLVGRDQLVEGNSKLEMSASAAQIVGPGVGGLLVQAISAPVAILVDCVSFIVSSQFLRSIDAPEQPPQRSRRHFVAEIAEGLRFVLGDRWIRPNALCAVFNNLAYGLSEAVYILYATRELGFSPGLVGLIVTSSGIGLLCGAWLAANPPRWIGYGTATILGVALYGVGIGLAALAGGALLFAGFVLALGRFISGIGDITYTINTVSLRQRITPDALLGRMNGAFRVVGKAAVPVGALLGGIIGEAYGLRVALLVAAACGLLAVPWLWFSPWRTATAGKHG
jgi:MFS family permease